VSEMTGARAAGSSDRPSAMPSDDGDWDRFVAGDPLATYLQVAAWARVKRPNGWRARRVVAEAAGGAEAGEPGRGWEIGGQILLQRPRLVPWTFAYAPRGPLVGRWSADVVHRWTETLRSTDWGERVAHVRMDPEVEAGGPDDPDGSLRAVLGEAGWRPGPTVQPKVTRVVDLRSDEAALWSGLRKKWRQYVNKGRAADVRVVDVGADQLPAFHALMAETASRAGTRIRAESAYRDVWEAYAPSGAARLLFAIGSDGELQAALFLLRCGDRVVEPYGGMTATGAASRANYLVKWEAMRSSREAGAVSYDMWGLVHPGIRQFKAGFGGREIELIGSWDLPLDPVGATTYHLAERVRDRSRRRAAPADPPLRPALPNAGPEDDRATDTPTGAS
jgi:lipid II:glycine glycyltransferase (peptidoglycan interpeptide bridge formation enzyme)